MSAPWEFWQFLLPTFRFPSIKSLHFASEDFHCLGQQFSIVFCSSICTHCLHIVYPGLIYTYTCTWANTTIFFTYIWTNIQFVIEGFYSKIPLISLFWNAVPNWAYTLLPNIMFISVLILHELWHVQVIDCRCSPHKTMPCNIKFCVPIEGPANVYWTWALLRDTNNWREKSQVLLTRLKIDRNLQG